MQGNQPILRYNSYRHLLFVTLNICLSSWIFGVCNGYFNSIKFADISNIYQLDGYPLSTVQGVLTGIISFTAGIGAYLSKYLLNYFTRKRCFEILSIATILTCILVQYPTLPILFISRCLQGMIIGMISSVTSIYVRQFVPIQLSSYLYPYNQIGMIGGLTFAFILTFLLSLFFQPQIYWRIVFAFPSLFAIVQLYNLKYNFPYQTPKYLLLQNDTQGATALLSVIYKKQYVQDILKQLKLALEFGQIRKSRHSQVLEQEDIPTFHLQGNQHQKQELSKQLIQIKPKKLQPPQTNVKKQLQTNTLAKIAAIHLPISQQMVGMGPIIAYSGEIVGQMIPAIEKVFPILINSLALGGAFLTSTFLKAFDRKTNFSIGFVGLGTMLILESITFWNYNFDSFEANSWFVKLSICLLLLGMRFLFSFTMGPFVWLYIPQIAQPNFIPITSMANWITVALVNTIFPIVKEALGGNPSAIFLFFGLYTLTGFFVNKILLVQTKNKTEYQIMKQYQEKWKTFKSK